MSVNQFLNGKLNLIAGAGGGSVIADDNTFTGTTAEVEAAIADGLIEDDTIVFITDDTTEGGGEEIIIEVLDTYDEIMTNTELGKVAGAAGVKEGFEKIQYSLIKTIILPNETDLASAMTTAIENNITKNSGAFNFLLSISNGNYCIQGYATPSHASGFISQQAAINGWQFFHAFEDIETSIKNLYELTTWKFAGNGQGNNASVAIPSDYKEVLVLASSDNTNRYGQTVIFPHLPSNTGLLGQSLFWETTPSTGASSYVIIQMDYSNNNIIIGGSSNATNCYMNVYYR